MSPMKRCEAMLEKIDGTFEQCDTPAEAGSDYCWECMQIGNKTFRRETADSKTNEEEAL